MSGPAALAAAEKVADAVMCEGQVLYPYRASAAKNRLRWQFGVLTPRSYAEREGGERWSMTSRCLLDAGEGASVSVRARFVRSRSRTVVVDGREVESAEVGGRLLTSFDETVEESVDAGPVAVSDLLGEPLRLPIRLAGAETVEAPLVYRLLPLEGLLSVSAEALPGPYGLLRVAASLENLTGWEPPPGGATRGDALQRSMIAAHLLLATTAGRWLSAVDPPEFARGLAGAAEQEGCFPVLVGDDDRVVLAAPIILYDHPEVAPESAGDYCDATEIDEILSLRTLALTDEEKREARATDGRAAEILDRCDNMPPEVWARLHGAIRSMRPAGEEPDYAYVGATRVRAGTRVRLRPAHGADAQDLFLDGKSATVTGVFTDFDGEVHLAVTVDDDPGADMHSWYGRFRYFKPHEVEVLR